MLRFYTVLVSVLFLLSSAFSVSFAQSSDDTLYLKVDYFKAAPDQISEYLHVEQELWKPIHQARVDEGIILGWAFYGVFAGEPEVPYNYIAVNVFDEFDLIDYYQLAELVESVYPDLDLADFFDRTRASREVVRTEIWKVNGTVQAPGQPLPFGNYVTANFFDERESTGEHASLELDFWSGIHQTRIEEGSLNSWGMYTLLYPEGDARHYTYSTMDFYDRLGDLITEVGTDQARTAHPDLSYDEIHNRFTRTGQARSLYKTEIWNLLDSVGYD
jgi:hypothetical protein